MHIFQKYTLYIFYMSLFYSFVSKFFASLLLLIALSFALAPSVAYAQNKPIIPGNNILCKNAENAQCPVTGNTTTGLNTPEGIAKLIINIASFVTYVVGAISVLFLVYGGFLYVTDTGDDKNSGKAKKILVNAVIGLIIAIVAITVVSVIGNIVSGTLISTQ